MPKSRLQKTLVAQRPKLLAKPFCCGLQARYGASLEARRTTEKGVGRGDSRGVDQWRLDPARRRSGAGDGLAGISKSQVSKLCKEI